MIETETEMERQLREILKHSQSSIFNEWEQRFIREIRNVPYRSLTKHQKAVINPALWLANRKLNMSTNDCQSCSLPATRQCGFFIGQEECTAWLCDSHPHEHPKTCNRCGEPLKKDLLLRLTPCCPSLFGPRKNQICVACGQFLGMDYLHGKYPAHSCEDSESQPSGGRSTLGTCESSED